MVMMEWPRKSTKRHKEEDSRSAPAFRSPGDGREFLLFGYEAGDATADRSERGSDAASHAGPKGQAKGEHDPPIHRVWWWHVGWRVRRRRFEGYDQAGDQPGQNPGAAAEARQTHQHGHAADASLRVTINSFSTRTECSHDSAPLLIESF
jgi:hypothetical protein